MADAGDLGLQFGVDDQASEPLGEIEDAYISLMKTMGTFHKKLQKSLKGTSDGTEEAGESAKKAGEEQEKESGKLREAADALKENALGLDELKISWNSIIKALTAVSVGAAIVSIFEFFRRAMMKALEFRKELAKLNETYSMTAKDTVAVAGTLLSLTSRAGRTRDEVSQLVKAMLDLALTPSVAKKAGTSFRALARDALDFSSATGASLESAAELTDQLIRINQIPANNIRNIGYSIKNVADQSRISADELVQFNKGLEPLFAFLIDKSGDARTKFTQEMTGIAGVLSDVGIDANKATSQFAEMLDRTSEEGAKALGQLASFTGRGTEELRNMIMENPSAVFDTLAESASRMSPEQLQLMARSLQPLGLGFSELTRLSEGFGVSSKQNFQQAVRDIIALNARDDALAKAAAKRQERVSGIMDRFGALWDSIMIKIGGAVLDNLAKPFMEEVVPAVEEFVKWLGTVDWNGAFSTLFTVIKTIWKVGKFTFDLLKVGFQNLGDFIGLTFGTIASAIQGLIALFLGDWGRAADIFKGIWESIVDTLKGMVARVLRFWLDPLKKLASIFPGGDKVASFLDRALTALEGPAEKDSNASVSTPDSELRPPRTTVREATGKGGKASKIKMDRSSLSMPDRIITTSPKVEILLNDQNALLLRMARSMEARGSRNPKSSMVLANAGEF